METIVDKKIEEWSLLFGDFCQKHVELQADEEIVTPEKFGKKLVALANGRSTVDGEPIGIYCGVRDLEHYLVKNVLPSTGINRVLQEMILECPETIDGLMNYSSERPVDVLDVVVKRCKLVWTSKLPTTTDVVLIDLVPVKASVIPALTRDLDPDSPEYQLVISLPWWVLSTDYERMQALHYGFCHFGRNKGKPVLRKHDIKQFSANLARYGLRDPREAQAFFAAQMHVDSPDRVNMWLPTGRERISENWPSKRQPADERDRFQLSLFNKEDDKSENSCDVVEPEGDEESE